MKSFYQFLLELKRATNADVAEVNEILLAKYLAGGWNKIQDNRTAQKQYKLKSAKLSPQEIEEQNERAKRMASESLSWAAKNGYKGGVKKIYWTARKGSLQNAVGKAGQVDRGNPTDVLIEFSSGQFLGISAKTTLKNADIGFKNPGLGTIEKSLGISDLTKMKADYEAKFIKKYKLPESATARKKAIRADPKLIEPANKGRSELMNKIRDAFLVQLNKLSQTEARRHLLDQWMDASSAVFPSYIKVTGKKDSTSIENPLENSKLASINKGPIKFSAQQNEAVGVTAAGKQIMLMRLKYESQAMASSMKFSGDPWKGH